MNHKDVLKRMPDYLEGALPLAERALFDAHVSECDSCGSELKELRQTVSLLRSLPDPEPPGDLVDNVMQRIRAGEGRPSWSTRVGAALGDWLTPGMALPATAFAAGLALYLMDGRIPLPGVVVSPERVAVEQAAPDRIKLRLNTVPSTRVADRAFAEGQPRLPQQTNSPPVTIEFGPQPRGASVPPGPFLARG